MRRHTALLACALVGVAPTMAMPLSGAQATTSRTPAIVGVAAQRPQNQGAAGVWASTEISLIQYRNVTTGTNAPTSGTRIELDLSHPGRYTYSALLQVTSYSCTDSLFAEETGKAVVAGDRLTLAPGTSRFTSRDNCVAKFNYSKPGSLAKRTYQWKVDRLQRGTKLCLRNNSGHGGSGCYWRDKPETAPTADAAGATWARRHVSTNATLWGVSCRAGGRTCLAGGDEGAILTSADGGATWAAHAPGIDNILEGNALHSIACPGAGRCVAVGDQGTILTSADTGATWAGQIAAGGDRLTPLRSVSCAAAHACVAVGESGIILQLRV